MAGGPLSTGSSIVEAPTTALRGVGPALAERLAERGIHTVGELLQLLPRSYEDRSKTISIADLRPGQKAAVRGRVVAAGPVGGGRGRRYEIALGEDDHLLRLVYFNYNPYRMRLEYRPGEKLWAFGLVSDYRGRLQMAHPEISRQEGNDRDQGIVPVYADAGKLPSRTLRRITQSALELLTPELPDPIPTALLDQLHLPGLAEAYRHIHQPTDDDDLMAMCEHRSPYHQRLAFDEFFYLQLVLGRRRQALSMKPGLPLTRGQDPVTLAHGMFPFALTRAQQRVVNEITADLMRPVPMARLLQGDVGSGKTAVAAVAIALAVRSDLQCAVLAPTEILAEQHLRTLTGQLATLGIQPRLLTGSTRAATRRELLRELATGEVEVLVGTHAILQEDVDFARLGLAVVDEQHRFGVAQRAVLARRGPCLSGDERAQPHQLIMTATPIPRSLSMTLYGDLALSVLDEMPAGRLPVRTEVQGARATQRLHREIERVVAAGGRVFVVYPLVEESAKLDLASATEGAASMRAAFPGHQVGLLTGRMPAPDKEAVMAEFACGRTQILVATTVVEVGVDVPEATLMVVFNAERFGLSQLHQLRGRVGRGAEAARCLLISGDASQEALKRLRIMERTNDGFVIAEEDLAIRGPGDLLGTRQHGLPEMVHANLLRHGRLLELAQQTAREVIAEDPALEKPRHQGLRKQLEDSYRRRLELLPGG